MALGHNDKLVNSYEIINEFISLLSFYIIQRNQKLHFKF